MANFTPADVADIFKESVSFNAVITDTKEIISSSQIIFSSKCFEALTDKDSFKNLLKSIKGLDRNTRGIFEELHDADLGIMMFADGRVRKTPRRVVALFLNKPEYSYHESDLSELYFAVNTWLAFFGEEQIPEEWEKCPMCGSAMRDYVCTAADCRTGSYIAFDAMLWLDELLINEAKGIPTADPDFWEKIKDGSEFDIVYKKPIEEYRRERSGGTDGGKREITDDLASALKHAADTFTEDDGVIEVSDEGYANLSLTDEFLLTDDYFDEDDDIPEAAVDADALAKQAEDEEKIRLEKLSEEYARLTEELKQSLCDIQKEIADFAVKVDADKISGIRETAEKADALCTRILNAAKGDEVPIDAADLNLADTYMSRVSPVIGRFIDDVVNRDAANAGKIASCNDELDEADRVAADRFAEYSKKLYDTVMDKENFAESELSDARAAFIRSFMGKYEKSMMLKNLGASLECEFVKQKQELSELIAECLGQKN